jgi:hypothetical protein
MSCVGCRYFLAITGDVAVAGSCWAGVGEVSHDQVYEGCPDRVDPPEPGPPAYEEDDVEDTPSPYEIIAMAPTPNAAEILLLRDGWTRGSGGWVSKRNAVGESSLTLGHIRTLHRYLHKEAP